MIRESDGKRFLLVISEPVDGWDRLVSLDGSEQVRANCVMTDASGADHFVSADGETYVMEMP